MRAKRMWTVQSFLTCFLINAILVTILYFVADRILEGFLRWVSPFAGEGAAGGLPEDAQSAFMNLGKMIHEITAYLAPVIFGLGGAVTFLLWLFILVQGRGLANRAFEEASAAAAPVSAAPGEETGRRAAKAEKKAAAQAPPASPAEQFVQATPQAAVQMLSILQREGRLIDFLQEDLSVYDDAQIGAAVRNIHQGCKGALAEYVEMKPIYEESEGAEITVPPGFDPRSVRLTGNVAGDPPFKGILRHRGWQVIRMSLPRATVEQKKDWVLAPAEVEVGGE